MKSNESTLPVDSLSMLDETAINNAYHASDEESAINHHFVNEFPPYLKLLRQMFPRK